MFKPMNLAIAGSMALSLLLVGCGTNPNAIDPTTGLPYSQEGYGSGYGSSYGSTYGSTTGYGSTYGSTTGYGSTGYGSSYGSTYGSSYPSTYGSSYGSTTGYGTSYGATAPGGVTGNELLLGQVSKSTSGILFWKKCTANGSVRNQANYTVSGQVEIEFMNSGKVVETQYEYVTNLAPGQVHNFSLTSTKAANDVQCNVTTTSATQNPAYANPTGAYGSSYGSSPYGSSYGTGYGSTYGSSGYPTTGYPTTTPY